MDEKKIKALATELAKNLKTEEDLNLLFRAMKKVTVEVALNVEISDHLGHEKGQPKSDSNTRNGYSTKTIYSEQGPRHVIVKRFILPIRLNR